MIRKLRQQASLHLTLWVIGGIALLQIWAVLNQKRFAHSDGMPNPFLTDALGYYAYLPAGIIHGDLDWEWTENYPQLGFAEDRGKNPFFYRSEESGRYVNKYPVGVALMELPFFLLGHVSAQLLGYESSGFSPPYRLLVMLGGILYALLAFLLLRKVLRQYYTEWVTAAVILALALGTNLLHYTIQEPGMSHVYSFFTMSLVVACTFRWRKEGQMSHMLLLALGAGLTLLIRPSNGLILLFPLLYGGSSLREQFLFFAKNIRQILAGLALGLLVISPQLLYGKIYGGSWLYDGYGDEGFLFSDPKIWEVLLGFRKGWFVYSPVLLGILPGFFLLRRYVPGATLPLIMYALLNLYVVSSWWNWWYGGSLGMRALIETTAPLSLVLAAFFAWMSEQNWRKLLLTGMLAFFLLLNLIQTYQYKWTYIHWENMNARVYWQIFMRPRIPADEFEELKTQLAPPPDYGRRNEGVKD